VKAAPSKSNDAMASVASTLHTRGEVAPYVASPRLRFEKTSCA
jgi:hypothetical protein